MSRNAGYQVLDLNYTPKLDNGDTYQLKSGTYESLVGTNKPIIVSGLWVYTSRERDIFSVRSFVSGTNFQINISLGGIAIIGLTISNADVLTVTIDD